MGHSLLIYTNIEFLCKSRKLFIIAFKVRAYIRIEFVGKLYKTYFVDAMFEIYNLFSRFISNYRVYQ